MTLEVVNDPGRPVHEAALKIAMGGEKGTHSHAGYAND